MNSLLTSRYGAHFIFQPDHFMGIPDKTPSLAELLREGGFSTAAFSASPIVRATPSEANPDGGFGRGFDVFDEECHFREAECLDSRALEWVADTRSPFFLFVHYMEPHDPYLPPPGHRRRFAGEYDGPRHILDGDPNPIAEMVYGGGEHVEVADEDISHLLDLYDEEIAYYDDRFSNFIEGLEKLGVLGHSIVIIASDHGEEFMDHGDHIKHCRVLYDTSTRVPLIIRVPGVPGQRVGTAVENIDIMPTVLDYTGVSAEGIHINGHSLRPVIEGGTNERRIAFSDQGRWRSADDGRFKLLLDGVSLEPQLFDLASDPLEVEGVQDLDNATYRDLGLRLNRWLTAHEGGVGNRDALAAGSEAEERLRALGYLQ